MSYGWRFMTLYRRGDRDYPHGKEMEKSTFHSNPKERQCQRMLKLPQIALISHNSKVMLKSLQVRLQQYVIHELPDFQAGFRKGRGTRVQIANICWIIEKTRVTEKYVLLLIDYTKVLTVWITKKLWKIL